MLLTDEMLMAAFRYRETMLWKYLNDSNLFAFRLSDGETGYCCVMGNAGEHLALGFYRGAKGFASFMKSMEMNGKDDLEMMEMAMMLDCINCDFMNADGLTSTDAENKVRIREFAKANGFKIRRPKGWPDFTCHKPHLVPAGIYEEKDAKDITEALNAATAVAARLLQDNDKQEIKKRFKECGFTAGQNYPTKKGGKIIPFLVPNADGTYEWTTTSTPAMEKEKFDCTEFNNMIMAGHLKAMQHRDTLHCRMVHLPNPIDTELPGKYFYPSMLLCIKESDENVLPVMPNVYEEDSLENTLNNFASALMEAKSCPTAIKVADDRTKALLQDFCKKTGIRLQTVPNLPLADEAWDVLSMFFETMF